MTMETQTGTGTEVQTPAPDVQDASSTSEPDVDTEALREALDAARSEATLQSEIANLKRATGHIPGVQAAVDRLSSQVADYSATKQELASLRTRFDAFVNALPEGLIPERVVASLRPGTGDDRGDVLAKLAQLEERLANPPQAQTEQPLPTPEQATAIAMWDTATTSVIEYARKQNLDPGEITEAVWQAALTANINDPVNAAVTVMKHVDSLVATKKRQDERQDAGKGGTNGGARVGRTGPVTAEQMKTMTVAEVQAIPYAERMAALSR